LHIDLAEVRTAQGKIYLIVALDRTSKFAFVEMHEKVARHTAGACEVRCSATLRVETATRA
jgi:hypothetical protein